MLKINNIDVPITWFPDSTTQVWKLPEELLKPGSRAHILWKFSSEAEFLHLAQLKDLLDHSHVVTSLTISYLPYGRQDKPVSNTSTFALTTFARLLNSLKFDSITIVDPHSIVALDLIVNSSAQYYKHTINDIIRKCNVDMICYPDDGAQTKYSKVLSLASSHIYGEKVRDQLTGNILSYKVFGDCAGKNVLIVDDICDGGMTFKLLAKDLLAAGAKEVNLFVTHGIFSKGLRTLRNSGINRIFTKDGEASEVQDRIIYGRL